MCGAPSDGSMDGGQSDGEGVPMVVDVPRATPVPAPLAAATGVPEPSVAPADPTLVSGPSDGDGDGDGSEPSEGDGDGADPSGWFDAKTPDFLTATEFDDFDDWFVDRYKNYKSAGLRTLLWGRKASTMTDFFRLLELVAPPDVYMKFAEDAIVWTSRRRRAAAREIKSGELDREQQEFNELYRDRMTARRLNEAWGGVKRGIDEEWNNALSDAKKKFRQKSYGYARSLCGLGMVGGAAAAAYVASMMDSDTEDEDDEEEPKKKRKRTSSGSGKSDTRGGREWSDNDDDDGGGKPSAV